MGLEELFAYVHKGLISITHNYDKTTRDGPKRHAHASRPGSRSSLQVEVDEVPLLPATAAGEIPGQGRLRHGDEQLKRTL